MESHYVRLPHILLLRLLVEGGTLKEDATKRIRALGSQYFHTYQTINYFVSFYHPTLSKHRFTVHLHIICFFLKVYYYK